MAAPDPATERGPLLRSIALTGAIEVLDAMPFDVWLNVELPPRDATRS